jgi:3-isopropylmalate/(R)-2-methylmalate dehydratase large subunit
MERVMNGSAKTMFDKVWDPHVVADLGGGNALLHIDRHLMHDLGGPVALAELQRRGIAPRNPELTFATPDHAVSTSPGRSGETNPQGGKLLHVLRQHASQFGIRLFDLGEPGQGIVHVMGPEQGISLPGLTMVCGDSHTCTHGGLGALSFGIGSSELLHVLATQTLVQKKPKRMRVNFVGNPAPGVGPKDLVLAMIGQHGAAAGTGYAVEYAGDAIRKMSVEGRMTICNLSIEFGAKIGMIAPDDVTFEYVAGRPYAPSGEQWDLALRHWRTLNSDGATFDRELSVDVASIAPQVTWGTSPEHTIGVDGRVPDPAQEANPDRRKAIEQALAYMGLQPGQAIAGTPVDWVFIGSCTNSRMSDLRLAAETIRGRKVAAGVRAWVVPGSGQVKLDAEAEGLDRIFRDAGFEWREPGCSMCVAANGETVPAGQRSVSTSNRNFVGRQGPGARTHLASPASAVAAALAGKIVDVRTF